MIWGTIEDIGDGDAYCYRKRDFIGRTVQFLDARPRPSAPTGWYTGYFHMMRNGQKEKTCFVNVKIRISDPDED
jgi:hypothetical protein